MSKDKKRSGDQARRRDAPREEHPRHHAEIFGAWRQRRKASASGKEAQMTVKSLNDLFVETLRDSTTRKGNW